MPREIGVTQETAWFMLHRLHEAWVSSGLSSLSGLSDGFDGRVEVYEISMGGKLDRMHSDKHPATRLKPNYGKSTVAGMRDLRA